MPTGGPEGTVRGRYAPSPTGHQTVGNARTAILAWLDVRSRGGSFVLRLDDTDPARQVTTGEEICLALSRLGLDWDESWEKAGPWGPYTVSERVERHRERADWLCAAGAAYWDYTPPIENVESHKKTSGKAREARAAYRGSATAVAGVDPVLRFRMPEGRQVSVVDRVFGKIVVDTSDIGEVALVRSDGRPTYHLASCVDDIDMHISSVVRGADWLNFLPVHVLLFEVLDGPLPEFAHVPLLTGEGGQKLSKRQGDLSIRQLVAVEGVAGGALACYLSNLGFEGDDGLWELLERAEGFDISRMGKSSPSFDRKKLGSFSRRWLSEKEPEAKILREINERRSVPLDSAVAQVLLPGIRSRISTFADAASLTAFVDLPDRPARDPKILPDALVEQVLATSPWEAAFLAEAVDAVAGKAAGPEEKKVRRACLTAFRDALSPGIPVTPPLHFMLAALGRERARLRLGSIELARETELLISPQDHQSAGGS